MIDPTRKFVQAVLEACKLDAIARSTRVQEAEAAGQRIVNGGQTGSYNDATGGAPWEITDWRTGSVLASGTGDLAEEEAAMARIDADGTFIHIDALWEDIEPAHVTSDELPPSLADALEEWVQSTGTPDEDIAEWAGWPLDQVRLARAEQAQAFGQPT